MLLLALEEEQFHEGQDLFGRRDGFVGLGEVGNELLGGEFVDSGFVALMDRVDYAIESHSGFFLN